MEILEYPNPILRQKSDPINHVTRETRETLLYMHSTMIKNHGVGLAAPQVGILKRMFVIDLNSGKKPIYLINPIIEGIDSEYQSSTEGCLSLPGAWGEVNRLARVKVSFTDMNGRLNNIVCEGDMAVVVQHELDHLDGVLHIDRMISPHKMIAASGMWDSIFNKNK